jgi:probable F420-dependent oxidoreductase
MIVATGILSIWVAAPAEIAAAASRLRAAHDDRFLLGLGVSHAELVDALGGGRRYAKPLQAMTDYLDDLDGAREAVPPVDRVLAALGPKMLDLARRRAGGAHPYNVTPEHTATARAAVGTTKLIVPEQAVALTSDADEGRRRGRVFLEHYLHRPNYVNSLRRIGFTDDDLAAGGSDRLVDALVAWGDEDAIATRVREHLDAGADSVCIQVVTGGEWGGMVDLPLDAWRTLAPALTSTVSR